MTINTTTIASAIEETSRPPSMEIEEEARVAEENTGNTSEEETPVATLLIEEAKVRSIEDVFSETAKIKQSSDIKILSNNQFTQEISKDMDISEVVRKIQDCRVSRINVKEIVFESETMVSQTAKKMTDLVETQVADILRKTNQRYKTQVENMDKVLNEATMGKGFLTLSREINKIGWIVILKDEKMFFVKLYCPYLPINEVEWPGEDGENRIRRYQTPICWLKGIYVNALHTKIIDGSIYLSTKGRHPNVHDPEYGKACPGTLADRLINVANPGEIAALLTEVAQTYQLPNLDSAYNRPPDSQLYTRQERESVLWIA